VAFEVDFLPVGDGKKSGDAIAVRYGQPGAYTIMIYDGGTQNTGSDLVTHVRQYYGTSYVDHVVNSHPDRDHSSGLSVVMEELQVGTLWMHRPWQYSSVILDYFKDGRITSQSLRDRLQDKMSAAYNLEQIATKRNITIKEPFQGLKIGSFFVLSPDQNWYVHELIADFQKSPEQKMSEAAIAKDSVKLSFLKTAVEAAKKEVTKWVPENWGLELLREDEETSAENDSSIILYAYMEDYRRGIILTGDAGVKGLTKALDYLDSHGVSASTHIKLYQIPHHGGRHNVSTSVLDRLVGPRLATKLAEPEKVAIASASKDSDYPRNMVRNAFLRRGAKVAATKGTTVRYHYGMPDRGWSAASFLEFSPQVESWE
jgi:beta-lactamase superfamily II metal-dependent hydrolase